MMNQATAVIRFLDRTPDGKYDLAGRAETVCPQCGQAIVGSGYFNACTNALTRHYSSEHGTSIGALS